MIVFHSSVTTISSKNKSKGIEPGPMRHLGDKKTCSRNDVVVVYLNSHLNICIEDILFPSNHNIHKSLNGLCFWASAPVIVRLY